MLFFLVFAALIAVFATRTPCGVFDRAHERISIKDAPRPIPADPAPEVGVFPASMALEGSMLVVSDLGHSLPDGLRARIAQGVAALRATGLELLGDHVTDPATLDEVEEQRQIDLLARARTARGAVPFDAEELPLSLDAMLSHTPELDLILWLAPDKHDADAFDYVLVSREHAPRRGHASTDTLDQIIEAAQGAD